MVEGRVFSCIVGGIPGPDAPTCVEMTVASYNTLVEIGLSPSRSAATSSWSSGLMEDLPSGSLALVPAMLNGPSFVLGSVSEELVRSGVMREIVDNCASYIRVVHVLLDHVHLRLPHRYGSPEIFVHCARGVDGPDRPPPPPWYISPRRE